MNIDAYIAGAGRTDISRKGEKTNLELGIEAVKIALEDSGFDKKDIDGIVTNYGSPVGVDIDQFAMLTGLNTRFSTQTWNHGRMVGSVLSIAAMAVSHGLANVVACVCSVGFAKIGGVGGEKSSSEFRGVEGTHGELPHYGLSGPVSGAAMSVQKYMNKYGVNSEDLAYVPITLRNHARLNPRALRRSELTLDDYHNSRYIVEPLHVFDCCQVTDGAVCILVTNKSMAKNAKNKPVKIIEMQGIRGGREEFIFSRPGLGAYQQSDFDFKPDEWDLNIFKKSGLNHADIDGLYTYDAFSPLVWYTLERFGYCDPGDAPEFVKSGNISLSGGSLPVNSNGGLLSEGHLSGWNHIVEIVNQLRGNCGDRQIKDARFLQWGTCFGDSLIFGGE
ncbi:acetyl-CoA acetyltransferase [Neobacillus niacini]|uniref:thiolase C-terminal domain-containing protein n=1 Tax=Neobacillus niacini TaxID=86668 RepID=UPI0028649B32|nr:hypothetical protein [Neobacillus niacini]MDR7076068.1 acetyl-CoA acetyltransferase [Neobacillus niacini]